MSVSIIMRKLKYDEKANLHHMDTDCFIVYVKQMIFIKTLQKILKPYLILDYESNYELDRPLHKRKKLKSNWISER